MLRLHGMLETLEDEPGLGDPMKPARLWVLRNRRAQQSCSFVHSPHGLLVALPASVLTRALIWHLLCYSLENSDGC